MKIMVMSCSPKKEVSLTYQTYLFLELMFPDDTFDVHFTTDGTFPDELADAFREADLILVLSSIYHFSVHTQMVELFRNMEHVLGKELKRKPITYMTTSGMNAEYFAHEYVEHWAERNEMHFISGLSMRDVGILSDKGKEELYCWFTYAKSYVNDIHDAEMPQFKGNANVMIVDTSETNNPDNEKIITRLKQLYASSGGTVNVTKLRDYKLHPCIACSACYTNRICMIQDDFNAVIDRVFLHTDVLIFVGTVELGTMGYLYKLFTDRQVQFGRCSLEMSPISLYVYSVSEKALPEDIASFKNHEEMLALMHGFVNMGFVNGLDYDADERIRNAVKRTVYAYNSDLMPQTSGKSVGINYQFARLAVNIQKIAPADYVWFYEHGWLNEPEALPKTAPAYDYKESMEHQKNRTIPYSMQRLDFNGSVQITERNPYRDVPLTERKRKEAEPFANGTETIESRLGKRKKGLFGRKKS